MALPRRGGFLALTIVLVVVPAATAGAQAPAAVDVATYAQRLDAAIAAMGAVPVPDRSAGALADAVAEIGLPLAVGFPDGQAVVVTETSLLGGIDRDADDAWERVADRLETAHAAVAGEEPAPTEDAASVAAAVDAAYGGTDQRPGLLERARRWLADAFGWFVDHTLGALARSGLLGGLVAIALLLAIALLVANRVARRIVPDERDRRTGGAAPEEIDWAAEAQRAIDAGDGDAAVRALYHLLLDTLDRRGIVEEAPALTAGECRDAVHRRRPALDGVVRGATETFERVTYGRLPAAGDDVERLLEAERTARSA
jgi:hypothetical protein